MSPPFKGVGAQKVLPCHDGVGGKAKKVSDLRFSYFVSPLPIIIDQSLSKNTKLE